MNEDPATQVQFFFFFFPEVVANFTNFGSLLTINASLFSSTEKGFHPFHTHLTGMEKFSLGRGHFITTVQFHPSSSKHHAIIPTSHTLIHHLIRFEKLRIQKDRKEG